jgi:hypothetical protein
MAIVAHPMQGCSAEVGDFLGQPVPRGHESRVIQDGEQEYSSERFEARGAGFRRNLRLGSDDQLGKR